MKIELEIAKYEQYKGLELIWEKGYILKTKINRDEVIISANSAGLISLAKHLLALSQVDVPIGAHVQMDEYNSLEDGSFPIVFEKI